MKFNPSDIVVIPIHESRLWQAFDYTVNGVTLFHERVYFPHNVFKPVTSEQWMPGVLPRVEAEKLAKWYGGKAVEHFYAPEGSDSFFIAFNDNDKAIEFCLTKDFDRLLEMEKVD